MSNNATTAKNDKGNKYSHGDTGAKGDKYAQGATGDKYAQGATGDKESHVEKYEVKSNTNTSKLLCRLNRNKWLIASSTTAVFLWEHFFRLNDLSFRPTVGINFLNTYSRSLFTFIGELMAHASSYLVRLNFPEVMKTSSDLANSLFDFFTSGYHVIKGYLATATTQYVSNTGLIYLGSFLLIAGIAYGAFRFYKCRKNSAKKQLDNNDCLTTADVSLE